MGNFRECEKMEDTMALPEYPIMSVKDYLALDDNSEDARYEYLDGELRMLAGGTNYHSAIIANATLALGQGIEKTSCWIFNSDARVQISDSCYVYPDITISCDPRDQERDNALHYPHLIVEVLSRTTEDIDRGRKRIYYLECPTLQEYVIIDSQNVHVEVYHREDDGWKLHIYEPGSTVYIASFNLHFPIESLYRGMKY
jgi:Uma2 family endonuclease